ncbi:MAG: hypothetical protein KGZ80_09550 [Methylomonas sp.]|nr:hypothetical protein [Methylomonas sp.]PPD20075.1 MAG: hypothetical protein CTY23_10025 [Methylomonas sp.]PPD25984.1 MAG: hypothetical protein CTY22_06595 [Methylomonas sp.]PPD37713.1 MAG: hypothetical protein CTY21_06590 [Methylomonas sp.]PPD39607.1 MAG: hypothetical protein CTY17_07855 [Methylomonas sp.]
MDNQLRKNRRIIVFIAAMSLIPFAIAWYLAKHPDKVSLGTNNGVLIQPPLPTALTDFVGYDEFSAKNIRELQGRWVMINLMPQAVCNPACDDGLVKTRQISLMMGKDIARIRRVLLFPGRDNQDLPKPWQEDARLLKAVASDTLWQSFVRLNLTATEGGLVIMDPLGNLMMHYPPGYDPYKVRNDLSKLLRISQIG